MNSKIIIIRSLIVIFCLAVIEVVQANNDDEQNPSGTDLTLRTVYLDKKTQDVSGIETLMLEPATYQSEFSAYGIALNLQPLIDLHHRYLLTQTERKRANAKYLHSEQIIERQQILYRHGVASKNTLQGQQLQLQVDKASADAAQVQGKALYDEGVLVWGKELTGWALSDNSHRLEGFLTGQQNLLRITLPIKQHLPSDVQAVFIEPSGDRSKAVNAELVSAAPHSDATIQGESYFFRTGNLTIKPGMRVAVWVPEQSSKRSGVVIPESALIWHLDQSFVFVESDDRTFTRRQVNQVVLTPKGYFIRDRQLQPGERVVVTGGQLLLSEEFRLQIPDEDDD